MPTINNTFLLKLLLVVAALGGALAATHAEADILDGGKIFVAFFAAAAARLVMLGGALEGEMIRVGSRRRGWSFSARAQNGSQLRRASAATDFRTASRFRDSSTTPTRVWHAPRCWR